MRTRTDIKNQITKSFIANEYVINYYELTNGKSFEQEFSLVSFENVLFDILSFSIYLLEQLFNEHNKEVDDKLYNQKSGRLPWYRYMALKFQYGFDLITDTDEFDNTGKTLEEIETSKIIKVSSVNQGDIQGVIIVKIAGETDEKLSPISAEAKTSVDAYFEEIKYAGSRVTVINYLPDILYLNLKIYRDPLVIDSQGNSIKNGGKPVETAIEEFRKELPFNGELILANLIDRLQKIEGVRIPHLISASYSYIDGTTEDYGEPENIDVKVIPKSGYFEVATFDNVEYVV